MSFLQRIGNGLSRFMYGRNGPDQLGLALVWAAILLDLINMFIKPTVPHMAVSIASTVVILWAIYRLFSRNLYARRGENAWFLQHFWWPLRRKGDSARQQAKDKEHKYFTCRGCGTVCRVPRGKGKIIITCPKCGGEIHGKS